MKRPTAEDPVAARPLAPWWLLLLGLTASAAEVVALVLVLVR